MCTCSSVYRQVLHTSNPPCLPFLGVYLTDLVMIDGGNTNIIPVRRGHLPERLYRLSSTPPFGADAIAASKTILIVPTLPLNALLQGTELINFDKRRKIACVIEEIQRYQQLGYAFRPVPAIQVGRGGRKERGRWRGSTRAVFHTRPALTADLPARPLRVRRGRRQAIRPLLGARASWRRLAGAAAKSISTRGSMATLTLAALPATPVPAWCQKTHEVPSDRRVPAASEDAHSACFRCRPS